METIFQPLDRTHFVLHYWPFLRISVLRTVLSWNRTRKVIQRNSTNCEWDFFCLQTISHVIITAQYFNACVLFAKPRLVFCDPYMKLQEDLARHSLPAVRR